MPIVYVPPCCAWAKEGRTAREELVEVEEGCRGRREKPYDSLRNSKTVLAMRKENGRA